jgi:AraC-like DNA-binding protein
MSLPAQYPADLSIAVAGRDLTPSCDTRAITVPASVLARFQRVHEAAGNLVLTAPEIIQNPDAARGLEQTFVDAMLACLDATDVQKDNAATRRHTTIVSRFHAIGEAHADQALYLPEVCAAIGVSMRTLFVCYAEQVRMSPRRYLLLRRLHLAQRDLKSETPATGSVTDIATRYGFWELGQFAVFYRQTFGESLSATLRRLPA